jgi:hypothetical protein
VRLDYVLTKETPMLNSLLVFALGLILGWRLPVAIAEYRAERASGEPKKIAAISAAVAFLVTPGKP